MIIPLGLASMLIQALILAWAYPRLFSTRRADWALSVLQVFGVFAVLAWSFTTLPVAAKYQMSSIADSLKLETAFTVLRSRSLRHIEQRHPLQVRRELAERQTLLRPVGG